MNVESILPGDDQVMLKRDTHREDEIKSIKTAWEELQPGRAAKVTASLALNILTLSSVTAITPTQSYLFSLPTHAHQL